MKKEILGLVIGVIIFIFLILFYAGDNLKYPVREVSETGDKVIKTTKEFVEKKTKEFFPSIEEKEKEFFNKVALEKTKIENKIIYFCDPKLPDKFIETSCLAKTKNEEVCTKYLDDFKRKNLEEVQRTEKDAEKYCLSLKSDDTDIERKILREIKDTDLYLRKIIREYKAIDVNFVNEEKKITHIQFLCNEWNYIKTSDEVPPQDLEIFKSVFHTACGNKNKSLKEDNEWVDLFDAWIKSDDYW